MFVLLKASGLPSKNFLKVMSWSSWHVFHQTNLPLHLALVSALFLIFAVLSLECYVCSSSSTNEECNKSTQECQQPLDTCMTIVDTLGNDKWHSSWFFLNYWLEGNIDSQTSVPSTRHLLSVCVLFRRHESRSEAVCQPGYMQRGCVHRFSRLKGKRKRRQLLQQL